MWPHEYVFSFTTIWNYITLKQKLKSTASNQRFTTIWNYITLKRQYHD